MSFLERQYYGDSEKFRGGQESWGRSKGGEYMDIRDLGDSER